MAETDGPTVTFRPSAAETMVEQFGWDVASDGTIVDGSGEPVESFNGHTLTADELGGIVPDEDGSPAPLRDNFVDVCDYVESKEP